MQLLYPDTLPHFLILITDMYVPFPVLIPTTNPHNLLTPKIAGKGGGEQRSFIPPCFTQWGIMMDYSVADSVLHGNILLSNSQVLCIFHRYVDYRDVLYVLIANKLSY